MELIVGNSEAIHQIDQAVSAAALSNVNVCIHGEPGTGKTLIARAIHTRGLRRGRPFVVLNCATLPPEGTKGSDPLQRAFRAARTGTLVLKDVGALSPSRLACVDHAIDGRRSLGGEASSLSQIDVRLISTTKEDLKSMIQRGQCTAELPHALASFSIAVPPLRKRRCDIPCFVAHFIQRFNECQGRKQVRGVTAQALRFLLMYDWPENVRELEECIDRAGVMADHKVIDLADLPLSVVGNELGLKSARPSRGKPIAARLLGISRDRLDPLVRDDNDHRTRKDSAA